MTRSSLKNVCRLLDTINGDSLPEQDFLEDLKRSIELTDKKNSRKPSQSYKPSSMKCIRNMFFQASGVETDDGDAKYTMIGICNSGSDIHIRIQQAVEGMKDNGIDCEYIDVADFINSRELTYLNIVDKKGMETKLFYPELNMSFMCDGIIKYKGQYYILELKTENSYKWSTRKGVAEEHYNQGTAYSIAFGLPQVLFVYICRDNLDMKAYMLNVTNDMKMNLIGKIEECDTFVKSGRVPPKPLDLPKNCCAYCNYKEMCERN